MRTEFDDKMVRYNLFMVVVCFMFLWILLFDQLERKIFALAAALFSMALVFTWLVYVFRRNEDE